MYALNFDELQCTILVKSIKSSKGFADPVTSNSIDIELEPSTPDNTVELMSAPSHLAEQEQSISDDSSDGQGHRGTGVGGGSAWGKMGSVQESTRLMVRPSGDNSSLDTTHDVDENIYSESG